MFINARVFSSGTLLAFIDVRKSDVLLNGPQYRCRDDVGRQNCNCDLQPMMDAGSSAVKYCVSL